MGYVGSILPSLSAVKKLCGMILFQPKILPILSLILLASSSLAGAAEDILFSALKEKAGYVAEPPFRWTEGQSGVTISNSKTTPRGMMQGEAKVPLEIAKNLPSFQGKLKVTLVYKLGSKGVAALTLTSLNGNQRLRFEETPGGFRLSWRDRTTDDGAIVFRVLPTASTEETRQIEVVIDPDSDRIEVKNGEIVTEVRPGLDEAPDVFIVDLLRAIASAQADTELIRLAIEEI